MTEQIKRRVAEGDEFEMVMPATDVCRHLQVAHQVRTVRIWDSAVQIRNENPHARPGQLTDDGQWLRATLTMEEAGIGSDDESLYVDPVPDELVQVCRDGTPVSLRMADSNAAMDWLLHHQGHSTDYAIKFAGYEVTSVRRIDDSATRDLAGQEPHLRGCMIDGYDDDRVNEVLGRISEITGVDLLCVWDLYDESGVGGNSQFYIRSHGRIHELGGDLWRWLNNDPDDPYSPVTPGQPDTWIGAPAEFTDDDLPWDDGWRNCAHRDIHTSGPESTEP